MNVVLLLTNSIGRSALAATGKRGLLKSWIEDLDAFVAREGKFNKFSVAYSPISPPPALWDYKCRKCAKFQPPGSCAWVEGDIGQRAWCAIWVPPVSYKPFTWPKELLAR